MQVAYVDKKYNEDKICMMKEWGTLIDKSLHWNSNKDTLQNTLAPPFQC